MMYRYASCNIFRCAIALTVVLISIAFFSTTLTRVIAADGDLDAAFGTGGTTVPPGVSRTFFGALPTTANDQVTALGIQSTGKIIAGGISNPGGGNSSFALTRYNTNGTADTSFGT